MGFVIFVAVVAGLIALMFVVDWANSVRQERRLRRGQARDGVDEFRVRNDRIIDSDFGAFSAKSVRDQPPRS